MNPTTAPCTSRLRPNTDASHPVIGRMIAFATRYEVSDHVASSTVADMLPAMCGSATFTTVVSSTSMKVPNMTAIATNHGLMARVQTCAWSGIVLARPDRRDDEIRRDSIPNAELIIRSYSLWSHQFASNSRRMNAPRCRSIVSIRASGSLLLR